VLYRWDFGDGSPVATTTAPTVSHSYRARHDHDVRVEATDSFGHRTIAHLTIDL
jgi:hypothetical protein